MTSSSTALSSQGSGRAMARPETWHWTEQQKAWRPSSQASISFLALLVDVYRSRCLRPVSRWSPLSHYIRLHRLGCTTAASTQGPLLVLVTALGLDEARCLAGLVWPELVCAECQGYMRPLLLCCCNLVSWSPTDCSLRPEAAAESSQLLSPLLQLLSNTRHTAVTSSTRKQPIPSHTILPCPASGRNLKQGRANIIDWIIFMGAVVEETILKECRGVLVASCECGWVCCLSGQAGPSLPPHTCQLLTSPLRGYSLLTVHAARAAEDDVTPLLLRQPIISYENNFPPRQHINNTNNLCIYCLL